MIRRSMYPDDVMLGLADSSGRPFAYCDSESVSYWMRHSLSRGSGEVKSTWCWG